MNAILALAAKEGISTDGTPPLSIITVTVAWLRR